MSDLNVKQLAFIREYPKDLNGKQAAIRAGYSAKTAEITASRLLSHVKVGPLVAAALDARAKRTEIDADYVLYRLAEIDRMDVSDIITDDHTLKPLKEWPKVWRQYVSGIDLAEMLQGSGDERVVAGILKKIKWPDKIRNLELLGKHVNVQAFRDRHELTGKDGGPIEIKNLSDEELDRKIATLMAGKK